MSTIDHREPAPTLEEVWRLFQETDRKFQETDRKFQETDRLMKERAQETERLMKEQREENERMMKELSRETNKQIAKLGNRLGEFVESFVTPSLIKLFQARDIEVHGLSRDISRYQPKLNLATQIDLFAVNGETCILIEVKSKFSIDDVNEHLERMDKFKPLFPEYADKKAYGAIAAMVMPDEVAKYAYRKGFFVLAQQGETVTILNDEKFKPSAW